MLPPKWSIRPISPRDIPDIYHICLLTGDAGQSAEGLHQYPELIGLIYGEPYFVVAPSFGFVLVRTQPDGREEILGCILGTPDTRKFEPAIDEQWFSQLRSDYPQNPYPFNSTQADRVMIDRIHQPETTPPEVLATTRAHIHIDLLPQAQRQGWGSKLMGKAVNYLKKQGCDSLFVGIEPENARGRAFYLAVGFKHVHTSWGDYYRLDFKNWTRT
ncbi:hypothetical protein RhiTH_004196 [Rhizoctonia solani]|uniref:FR47-like protein n=1 Tax=Rhizoctonia solani TaxID=456999 RepID=A0A8H7LS23_9AGAM|nr:FR47-like protein [Rhizoctonia solani]